MVKLHSARIVSLVKEMSCSGVYAGECRGVRQLLDVVAKRDIPMDEVCTGAFIGHPTWTKRLLFAHEYFKKECFDSESIRVSASSVAGIHLIVIDYETIKNKKHIEIRKGVSPALLALLSDATVSAIMRELLVYFRSEG